LFGYRRGSAPLYTLLLLGTMTFLLYIDRVNLATSAGFIMQDLGLSNTQLGLVFATFGYSYAIFQVIGGWFADRVGSRITLLLCGFVWVGTTIGTGLIGSLAALLCMRFLLGIGEGATLPAAGRALTSWTPMGRRGFAQGVTHSASRFGNAITPPLVALLVTTLSWRASFFVLGGVTSLWVVAWFLYFRDDPADHPAITAEDLAELPPHEVAHTAKKVPWGPLVRRIWPAVLVYFCYGWTGWLFFSWLPTFFLRNYHMNIGSSAIFSSSVFFAGIVGDALGGVISDWILARTGNVEAARRNVIAVSFLGTLVALIPVLLVHDLTIVTLSLGAAFFMLELTIAPIWAVPMDVAPRYAGTACGFVNAGAAVAGIISPLLFGFIVDQTGNWTLPFAGSIVLLLIGVAATFWLKPQHQVEDVPVIPPGTVAAE
jgi:MFS family permease